MWVRLRRGDSQFERKKGNVRFGATKEGMDQENVENDEDCYARSRRIPRLSHAIMTVVWQRYRPAASVIATMALAALARSVATVPVVRRRCQLR